MKNKICKECNDEKPSSEFPNSPHAKDGKLGYCATCWSNRMRDAALGRSAGPKAKPKKAKIGRPAGSKNKVSPSVYMANKALKAAGSAKEKYMVGADDGDRAEFNNQKDALNKAMEWKTAGFAVTLWRECQF